MSTTPDLVHALHVDDVTPHEVAPGITRKTLTESAHVRAWLIEFGPGTTWPTVDHHETEERYYVLSGEVVDGGERYPAGTYVTLHAGSSHRPGSEAGATMLGFNLVPGSAA
jgi:mannose-6-phosphate isomerase-like protein (cupin superfamily)